MGKLTDARALAAGAGAAAAIAGLACVAAPGASAADTVGDAGEAIIVVGTAQPIAREKLGRAVTVITAEQLQTQGLEFVADALRRVPGVAVTRQGSFGGLTQLRIRGGEANHVLVLVDGVEVSSADTGEVDLSKVLSQGVERIEILRGPQSGLYGSNALAGVISIVTRRGRDRRELEIEIEGGAFETYETSLFGSLGDEETYLSATATHRASEGFNASPVGDEKDGDESTSVYVRAGAPLSPTLRLDATARYVASQTDTDDFDFSGGPNQGLSIDSDGFSDTVDWDVGATATASLIDDRWVSALTADYTDTTLDAADNLGPFGSETSRTKLAAKSSFSFDTPALAHARHMLTGFVEHETETFRNTVPIDPSQLPEQERTLAGVGAEYRLELYDRLFLTFAARKDFNDDFADADTFSASAAYALKAWDARLHASAGNGVTNPTFTEQFGFFPGDFVGNPDLLPEDATSWDAGVEKRFADGGVIVDVTYFESRLNDEISNLFPTVVNEGGESTRRGVESSLTAQIGARWSVVASHTYTDSADPDGGTEIRRPEHMASLDVSGSLLDDRATLSFGVIYTGERYDYDYRESFAPVKTSIDASTQARLSASFDITDRVEAFGRVENLLDEDAEEVIGFNTPGRAAYAGLRVTLAGAR